MPNLVRCKVCGFIIREDQLGDVCPACGVPRTAFEPYKEKVSEKRQKILDMHLHPVLVHFPEAFGIFIFLLSAIGFISTGAFKSTILCAIPLIAIFLPLFAFFGILSGMLDGKTRFKKLNTPYLRKKIIFGTIFLGLSLILAIGSFIMINTPFGLIFVFFLSLACVLTGGILGLIGGSLLEAKLPN